MGRGQPAEPYFLRPPAAVCTLGANDIGWCRPTKCHGCLSAIGRGQSAEPCCLRPTAAVCNHQYQLHQSLQQCKQTQHHGCISATGRGQLAEPYCLRPHSCSVHTGAYDMGCCITRRCVKLCSCSQDLFVCLSRPKAAVFKRCALPAVLHIRKACQVLIMASTVCCGGDQA